MNCKEGRKVEPKVTEDQDKLKLSRELQNLRMFYNPIPLIQPPMPINICKDNKKQETVNVHYVYSVELASNLGKPKSYREAIKSNEKEKWIPAIKNKIENFYVKTYGHQQVMKN